MNATIHYLRPLEPEEDLAKQDQDPAPEEQAAEPKHTTFGKKREMPCGKKSKWKKRMDGKVVPRE